jgi:hypothetical protein
MISRPSASMTAHKRERVGHCGKVSKSSLVHPQRLEKEPQQELIQHAWGRPCKETDKMKKRHKWQIYQAQFSV